MINLVFLDKFLGMLYEENTVEKRGFLLEIHDANFYFTQTTFSWMSESLTFSSWEHCGFWCQRFLKGITGWEFF